MFTCDNSSWLTGHGFAAVMLGAQSIMLGINQAVIAGGMESMSNAPFLLPRNIPLKTVGHIQLKDVMVSDGLWDPYKDISMGSCAEFCADELSITREAQVVHWFCPQFYCHQQWNWHWKRSGDELLWRFRDISVIEGMQSTFGLCVMNHFTCDIVCIKVLVSILVLDYSVT